MTKCLRKDVYAWFCVLPTVFFLLCLIVCGMQCDSISSRKKLITTSISTRINDFAIRLHKHVSKKGGNIVVSPFYLYRALSYAYKYAFSKAKIDLKDAFHYSDNEALIDEDFTEILSPLKQNMTIFESTVFHRDDDCNQTFRISIPPLSPKTTYAKIYSDAEIALHNLLKMIAKPEYKVSLLSYIFFSASWSKSLRVTDTREADFHVTKDEIIKSKMMCGEGHYHYTYSKLLRAQVMKIPLQVPELSLITILPNNVNGVDDLVRGFTQSSLKSIDHELRPRKLQLCMPRLNVTFESELRPFLKKMGLSSMFDPGAFSDICPDVDHLDLVQHESTVEISEDETGTHEVESNEDLNVPETEMRVDHPFLFTIRDETTGTILFIGTLKRPTEIHHQN